MIFGLPHARDRQFCVIVLAVKPELLAVGPSEEDVFKAWKAIVDAINPLMDKSQTDVIWQPHPGSSIAADDARTMPYQCSHAIHMALSSSLDHLHALTALLFEAGVLHPYAPFTLARGAIENAAIAFWLLHPKSRRDRIERTLRFHSANIQDSVAGAATAGAPSRRTKEQRMASLRGIAERNSCDVARALTPMRTTAVVRYADDHEIGKGKLGPLFAWQMCSGFSHGRPWSSLGVLERHEVERDELGNIDLRQTNSLDRMLYPALTAFTVFKAASKMFDARGRP